MLRFQSLPTEEVRALQAGAPDAYGHAPELHVSDGGGNPCRHCLRYIPEGAPMLILAHRPFSERHPYAETGPIFLCADPCEAPQDAAVLPEILTQSPDYLIKGYGRDDRIAYGTGKIVKRDRLAQAAEAIFDDPRVAYVHVRSARNNCYQLRIDKA